MLGIVAVWRAHFESGIDEEITKGEGRASMKGKKRSRRKRTNVPKRTVIINPFAYQAGVVCL
jgi:hypothetical protein